jgi:hypothetical protein
MKKIGQILGYSMNDCLGILEGNVNIVLGHEERVRNRLIDEE